MGITRGRVRGSALGGVLVLLLAGCTAPDDGGAPAAGPEGVDWAPCLSQEELEEAPEWDGDPEWLETLECGTLTVPLDHADPDGDTVDLALARRPASGDADQRIGSLVVNPGGPGESGVTMLDHPLFDDEVQDAFDLVGFDPRGVGDSEGFACGDWFAMDDARQAVADAGDVTDADLTGLEESARAYADSCAETVGEEFLANMGTVNVVRDLDLIRDALGDERLSYVGFSYGTYIGALYAEMFPENTRALVLDGAVETERPNVEVAADQAEAFQGAWDLFVDECAYAARCPFDGTATADARMGELLERLDADPPTVRGWTVDGDTLLTMVSLQLYDEGTWPELAEVLAALDEDVDGAGLQLERLYDDTFGQEEEGTDDPESSDDPESAEEPGVFEDTEAALTAVNCADRADPTDADVYRDAAQRASAASPYFGADFVWEQLPCAYWVDTEEAPTGFSAPDAPPIIVVGTLGDPATPYTWAEELTDQLDTATLVTYEGAGHTAYGYGMECVDGPVDAYLLDGVVPEPGLSCPAW
ncbi:alpha/beta hydrolase [Nocardiopsis sp. NPDC058789]|uniref:alpha/beta hydrolase n=1 Tax=Nocardiopsis sp. NPDC058789 TaxID=3346634 RepID=UPI00366BF239